MNLEKLETKDPEEWLLFDAHLDLSMNVMEWNRDLRKPISEIREREKGHTDKPDRGNGFADFEMTAGVVYAVRVGIGGGTVSNLSAPTCGLEAGSQFPGTLALTFRQP